MRRVHSPVAGVPGGRPAIRSGWLSVTPLKKSIPPGPSAVGLRAHLPTHRATPPPPTDLTLLTSVLSNGKVTWQPSGLTTMRTRAGPRTGFRTAARDGAYDGLNSRAAAGRRVRDCEQRQIVHLPQRAMDRSGGGRGDGPAERLGWLGSTAPSGPPTAGCGTAAAAGAAAAGAD